MSGIFSSPTLEGKRIRSRRGPRGLGGMYFLREGMMKALLVLSTLTAFLWPLPHSRAAGMTPLLLPYGISLLVPAGWRADRSGVQERLSEQSTTPLRFENLVPDSSGHLIILASPLGRMDEASLEISIMPTEVSQPQVRHMTQADIDRAGDGFRAEIEGDVKRAGLTLVTWDGTERVPLGGQLALVSRYRFRYPAKQDMLMESYGVYLGRRSVQLRVQYSAKVSDTTRTEVDQLRSSIKLALDHLDR